MKTTVVDLKYRYRDLFVELNHLMGLDGDGVDLYHSTGSGFA